MHDAEDAGSPQSMRYRYDAFISYSHAADGRLAPALQAGLEKIAKPWYRLRALHVFRDTTDLSVAPELWSRIRQKLAESRWFLLLASPMAGQSKWVRKEVEWWLANRSVKELLIVVTDGVVAWDEEAGDFDWTRTNALPPSLSRRFSEEPHYGDFTWLRSSQGSTFDSPAFRDAALGVSATIRGMTKAELDSEAVRTLRRNRRWAVGAIVTVVSFLAIALQSLAASREAQWQAEQAALQSRRTLANALAASAAGARAAGDTPAAIRLTAEAQRSALTPQVEASRLSLPQPIAQLNYILAPALASKGMAFAPDKSVLMLGMYDGAIAAIDTTTGRETMRVHASALPIIQLLFSPDGRRLYALAAHPADAAWNGIVADDPRSELIELELPRLTTSRRIERRGPDMAHFHAMALDGASGMLVLATDRDVVYARFEDLQSATPLMMRKGTSSFAAVTLSADGKYIAASDIMGSIRLRSLADGQEHPYLHPQAQGTSAYSTFGVSFDPLRPRAFFGATDGRAYSWPYTSGVAPRPLNVTHAGGVSFAQMSPDGRYLATSGWDGLVRITRARESCIVAACVPGMVDADLLSGSPVSERLPLSQSEITSGVSALVFSPDSSLLAAAQVVPISSFNERGKWMFGRVHVWSLAPQKQVARDNAERQESMRSTLSFTAKGQLFSLIGRSSSRLVLDRGADSAPLRQTVSTPNLASQLEQSVVARVIYGSVAGSSGGTIFKWASESRETFVDCAPAPRQAVMACVSATGGDHRSGQGLLRPFITIYRYGTQDERRIPLPVEQIGGAASMAWIEDASLLAVAVFMPMPQGTLGLQRGRVRVFVIQVSGDSVREVTSPHIDRTQTLAWRSQAKQLVIYDEMGGVGTVDMSGQETWLSNDNRAESSMRAFLLCSVDGNDLIAASESRLRTWKWRAGQWVPRSIAIGIDFKPTAATFSPDEKLLILGDDRGWLTFRDTQSLDVIATQQAGSTAILELAVSPDGSQLAVLSQQGLSTFGLPVSGSIVAIEHATNWTLADGRLVPLADPKRFTTGATTNLSPTFDAAASDLWAIVARNAAFETQSVSMLGWLLGRRPIEPSVSLRKWTDQHPTHSLASVLETLPDPAKR